MSPSGPFPYLVTVTGLTEECGGSGRDGITSVAMMSSAAVGGVVPGRKAAQYTHSFVGSTQAEPISNRVEKHKLV